MIGHRLRRRRLLPQRADRSPADVVARVLRAGAGDARAWLAHRCGCRPATSRCCSPPPTVGTVYVDVFVSFHIQGHADTVYYQLGNRSGSLPREGAVLPLTPITIEGVQLPGSGRPRGGPGLQLRPGLAGARPVFQFADRAEGASVASTAGSGAPARELAALERPVPQPACAEIPGGPLGDFAAWVHPSGSSPATRWPTSGAASAGTAPTSRARGHPVPRLRRLAGTPASAPSAGCDGSRRTGTGADAPGGAPG